MKTLEQKIDRILYLLEEKHRDISDKLYIKRIVEGGDSARREHNRNHREQRKIRSKVG